jgi:hypothetical protein
VITNIDNANHNRIIWRMTRGYTLYTRDALLLSDELLYKCELGCCDAEKRLFLGLNDENEDETE